MISLSRLRSGISRVTNQVSIRILCTEVNGEGEVKYKKQGTPTSLKYTVQSIII